MWDPLLAWNPAILTALSPTADTPAIQTLATGDNATLDAAGTAMTTQWQGLNAMNSGLVANVQQGQSMLNTVGGAVASAITIVQALQTLSVQAMGSILTPGQQSLLQDQTTDLLAELTTLNQTSWNTIPLFSRYAPQATTSDLNATPITSITPMAGWTGSGGSYRVTLAVSNPNAATTAAPSTVQAHTTYTTTPHTTLHTTLSTHVSTTDAIRTSTTKTLTTGTAVHTSVHTSTTVSTTVQDTTSTHSIEHTSVTYSTGTVTGPGTSRYYGAEGATLEEGIKEDIDGVTSIKLYDGFRGPNYVLLNWPSTDPAGTSVLVDGEHITYSIITPSGGEISDSEVSVRPDVAGGDLTTHSSPATGPVNRAPGGAIATEALTDWTYTGIVGATQTHAPLGGVYVTWAPSNTFSTASTVDYFYGVKVTVEGPSHVATTPHTSHTVTTAQTVTAHTTVTTSHAIHTSTVTTHPVSTSLQVHTTTSPRVHTSVSTSVYSTTAYTTSAATSYTTSPSSSHSSGLVAGQPVVTASLWQNDALLSTTSAAVTTGNAMTLTLGGGSGNNTLAVVLDSAALSDTSGHWSTTLSITAQPLILQTGPTNTANSRTTLAFGSLDPQALGLSTLSLASGADATTANGALATALTQLTTLQAAIGSQANALESQQSALQTEGTAITQSIGMLQGGNLPQALAQLTRQRIVTQFGMALLVDNDQAARATATLLNPAV